MLSRLLGSADPAQPVQSAPRRPTVTFVAGSACGMVVALSLIDAGTTEQLANGVWDVGQIVAGGLMTAIGFLARDKIGKDKEGDGDE